MAKKTKNLIYGESRKPRAQVHRSDLFTHIDVRNIKVGGEIGRRIHITIRKNLLKLDVDKDFLRPFQEKKLQGGYIGLGKLIDATVRLSAYSQEEKVAQLKHHIINTTIQAQRPNGYIGAMNASSRFNREWDVHEMAYIIYGLVNDYRCFGDRNSLESARKSADYILGRWKCPPVSSYGLALDLSALGLDRALLALSDATGISRYRDFVRKKLGLFTWNREVVLGRHGKIAGHAYAYLARCLAQTEYYDNDPDEKLLRRTKGLIDFLTNKNGMVITGTCGDHECWHDTQEGTMGLGETCATAYLIRLMGKLFRMEGNPLYGDIMERSIYNALFAAQSPNGRKIRYYIPFDGPRIYFNRDTYCCPNNFRRIIAELPEMIYYVGDRSLIVNLYTPSKAKIRLHNGTSLDVCQKTDYPNSGKIDICIDPSEPVQLTVRLRIPRWCKRARLAVNGKPVCKPIKSGTLFPLKRKWKQGDRIHLELPMEFRFVNGRKNQAGRVAIMRGPMLFCLNPALNKRLKGIDLRLLTIKPSSLGKLTMSKKVRHDGMSCSLEAWSPGRWYPLEDTNLKLMLTEFADPDGEIVYFRVPNPVDENFVDDELTQIIFC